MTINLVDSHVRYTKVINFGEEQKHVTYCDPIYVAVRGNKTQH
jgi:hypothetical protein